MLLGSRSSTLLVTDVAVFALVVTEGEAEKGILLKLLFTSPVGVL